MKVSHWAAVYFAVQGVAVIAWWLMLFLLPASRAYFRLGTEAETALLAFCPPDLLLLALGSMISGWLCWHGAEHAPLAAWFTLGTIAYASLYCLSLALLTDVGWLSVTFMLPAMLLTLNCTLAVSPFSQRMFRVAKFTSPTWNIVKTVIQIIAFWGIILFLVPDLITIVEVRIGIPQFRIVHQKPVAAMLFLCFSSVGLWSAFTMAAIGSGTPLPMDSPRYLVVRGPYAHLRNPMAVSGLGQGLSVSLWLGSPLVLMYVLTGAWIWQFLVRPLEEDDLRQRFGASYLEYCQHVRCWWPRVSPYSINAQKQTQPEVSKTSSKYSR